MLPFDEIQKKPVLEYRFFIAISIDFLIFNDLDVHRPSII